MSITSFQPSFQPPAPMAAPAAPLPLAAPVPLRPPMAPLPPAPLPMPLPARPGVASSPVGPTLSQRGNYFQDLMQVGGQRIQDYKNLVKDMLQVVLHPARAFNALKTSLVDSVGYGQLPGILGIMQKFGGLISIVLKNFVTQRITPYVTAFKEKDYSMVSALATVDVVDFLTFSFLMKGIQGIKLAASGKPLTGLFATGAKGVGKEVVNAGKYWAGVNGVGNAVVSTFGGIQSGRVLWAQNVLRQNGLNLTMDASALFSQQNFTAFDRYLVWDRMIGLNEVNYVSGAVWDWQSGRERSALKGGVQPSTVQQAELAYLRFMPEDRFQVLSQLCDLNDGYAFFQHAFATVPDAMRKDFPLIIADLYTYNLFMTSIDPTTYKLKQDPNQDLILRGNSDARDLAVRAVMTRFPGMTQADAQTRVTAFWRNNMQAGERPTGAAVPAAGAQRWVA